MGSLYYMAPEQVNGHPADARSDLYSVGITLYRLVTGRRAIDGQNEFALMRAQVESIPLSPHQQDSSIDPALSSVIMRAIAKDPAARFQTAGQFRAALMPFRLSSSVPLSFTSEKAGLLDTRTNTAALSSIQRHLAQALGPIASALVKRESRNAATLADLCRTLAEAIPPGDGRSAFLDACVRDLGGETASVPFSTHRADVITWDQATLERCRKSLASYVGPLAKVIVARAAKQARSIDELYHLVAAEIGDEADRRKFVASL
jgi:serine/threonine protein kinase